MNSCPRSPLHCRRDVRSRLLIGLRVAWGPLYCPLILVSFAVAWFPLFPFAALRSVLQRTGERGPALMALHYLLLLWWHRLRTHHSWLASLAPPLGMALQVLRFVCERV
jgi:hypothetical protein